MTKIHAIAGTSSSIHRAAWSKKRLGRLSIALGCCLLVSVLLASFSCAWGAENEVVVVSPHWDGIKQETSRAFRAWHQHKYGVPAVVRWRESGGGSSQILRFLRAEFAAGPSAGIDVLYGGGVDPFVDLAKDGLLTRYDPPPDVLAEIPPQLNGMLMFDPEHQWFGAALSGFGIITNQRALSAVGLPAAHTWADLADPRLAGWISASDPRASGSALQIYEIMLQSYGWDKGWATLMAVSGNVRNFLSSSASSAVETGFGDAAYGMAIDTYGEAQAAFYGSGNVSFALPDGQTVITPDGIAILKNPPHPELARHFLEFVLSHEGQMLWMAAEGMPGGAEQNVINRMSVWPSLYDELAGRTPVTTNPFHMKSSLVYSNTLGSKRRAILSALIAACMIDTHDALVSAWQALHSAPYAALPAEERNHLMTTFLTPPCTQAELLSLADNDWKNPVKRTALVNRWQAEALNRYKSVLAQIPGS